MQSIEKKFIALLDIIARLRAPDGCPWDRKQTPQSFKQYLIEEAHELMEAIDRDSPDEVKEELGDLLFQIIFLNNLYAEKEHFSLGEVIDTISAKMIRRHPHVFGDEQIASEEELRKSWYAIKGKENKKKSKASGLLSALPKTLPALRRAQRVSERAARTGFEWPDISSAIAKLEEELNEFKEAVSSGKKEAIADELGDILFALANIGRLTEVNTEDALQAATKKFINRFHTMERLLARSDQQIAALDMEALLCAWQEAKESADKN